MQYYYKEFSVFFIFLFSHTHEDNDELRVVYKTQLSNSIFGTYLVHM